MSNVEHGIFMPIIGCRKDVFLSMRHDIHEIFHDYFFSFGFPDDVKCGIWYSWEFHNNFRISRRCQLLSGITERETVTLY